jgi:heme exporter protein C
MKLREIIKNVILAISVALIMFGIFLAFVYVPPHEVMGDVQRIFYFHVAHAWVSYLAFIVTFVMSLVYLKTKNLKWDRVAAASAGIGVVYCTVAILTGAIWARAEWGYFWKPEDMKLNMTLVLCLIFVAYNVLRVNVKSKAKRANLSAVFGIIGALCVPLSFSANRVWNHFHPTVIASSEGSLRPSMGFALGISVTAFTLFYIYLMILKVEVEIMKEKAEELKQQVGDLDE